MNLKKPGFNGICLCLIIILGILLRFWHFSQLPLMYDELGALYRTRFASFSELMSNGIAIDGHPAGVQVFLYYLTHWFGYNEMILKLPFILMGIFSIYLAWWIGKTWFTEIAGLLTALVIATSEYSIMYSQIIRPYSSGMFFILLMVTFWTLYIRSDVKKFRNLTGLIIAGALCAYNHHFSMLMALIIGITGLFMLKRKKLVFYITACLLIMLLYVPHIPVTLHQLGYGGIGGKDGWLAAPDYGFLNDYVRYIFHYSTLLMLFVFGSAAIGIIRFHRHLLNTYRIIALVWFVLPLATGFWYSRLVNPVLQYSVLIFSFPFLLLFLFSFIPELKSFSKLIILTVLGCLMVSTLVNDRKYYDVFYHQGAREVICDLKTAVDEYGEKNVAVAINCQNPYHTRFYEDKFNFHPRYFISYFNDRNDFMALRDSLKRLPQQYLAIGAYSTVPLEYVNLCKDYYPYVVAQSAGFACDYYLLSKVPVNRMNKKVTDTCLYYSRLTFEQQPGLPWTFSAGSVQSLNGTAGHVYVMDSTEEYGPQFNIPLPSVINNHHNFVSSSAWIKVADTSKEAMLVFTIARINGEVINWSATPAKQFVALPGRWTKLHFGVRLSLVDLVKPGDMKLSVYIWNKGKGNIQIDDFDITVSQGNPAEYSLYEEF